MSCILQSRQLAVMFEGSTASGAERAYWKAVDKLTELLVAECALHAGYCQELDLLTK